MSPDWFDPLGLRGSMLDPFARFAQALKGGGLTGQSMDLLATTIARRLVGRRIEIDHVPPISATVERIDVVRPAPPIAAVSMATGELPMWAMLSGRLRDVTYGDFALEYVDLVVENVSLSGATKQRLRVKSARATVHADQAEAERWARTVAGDRQVRIVDGRIEVSDRRLAKWLWLEIDVVADSQEITVTPGTLRAFGHPLPAVARLRRPIRRPAPWLPDGVRVTRVEMVGDRIEVDATVAEVLVPIDVTAVLMDLSAEGTRSALRIALGDW